MSLSRRSFLKASAAAGGGLAVSITFPVGAQSSSAELNVWVVVQANESIVIRYARAEMGQGSMTSAAQLVAEELDCDWERVRVEYAGAHEQAKRRRPWGDMAAVASSTIRQSQDYLRAAGAAAREMLVAAAAQGWGVPSAECSASNGVITHTRSGRKTTYGRVAGAAAKRDAPLEVSLKDPKEWKLAGKPVDRVDVPDIVTGRMLYGSDTQLPGMAYAAVAHCPVLGGRLKSVDAEPIVGRRGVLKVVPMGNAVAVVADNWWRAREALRALPIQWEADESASSESIMALLREGLAPSASLSVAKDEGEAAAVLAYVDRVFEAEYFTPYLAHATLEPQTCTAVVKDGKVDVWTSTQDPEATHAVAAATAGVPPENVYVHRRQAGGAFGRRVTQDFTRQGVAIAKAMGGIPVQMMWTREEDLQHDRYRPASLVRLRAALDDAGYPMAWHARVSAPAIPGAESAAVAAFIDQPYAISHVLVDYTARNTPVPVGLWRGAGHSQNPFARECFLDELAHAAGIDPLKYRRDLLAPASKELGVLEAMAKTVRWDVSLPKGVHRGLAVSEAYGSYVAAVAELSVDDKGTVDIQRLVLGIDPGHIVNPDNVVAQMQGSAVFMLTALFWGEITLKGGRVEQSNFHDVRMMRLAEMPRIEVVLAPSGGHWGGIGEPAVAVVAPAVANALFAATGRRIRSLPLKNAGFDLNSGSGPNGTYLGVSS